MFRLRSPWLAGLALAAAAALAAGCGATALSMRVAAGQEARYHTTMNTTFRSTGPITGAPTLGQLLSGSTTAEYDATIHFDTVSASEAAITYTLSGFKVQTQMAGLNLPSTAAPQDMKFTLKINPSTGKVLEADAPQGAATGSPLLSKEQLNKVLDQTFAQLPAGGKAKVGASWTVTVPLPVPLPDVKSGSELTITTKYEADETRNGVKVARLVVSGSGPVNVSGTLQGIVVDLKGTMELTGTHYVDLKTGLTQEMASHVVFKYVQSMKEEHTGLNINADMESTTDVKTVRH